MENLPELNQTNYINFDFIFYKIYLFLQKIGIYLFGKNQEGSFDFRFDGILSFVYIFLGIIFLILVGLCFHIWLKIQDEKKKEREKVMKVLHKEENNFVKNEKWEHVKKLVSSDNQAEWRLAIIEADLILDEIVKLVQPDGETMGMRMKKIDKSDFVTLPLAMEAHGVRNKIAHEGRDFLMPKAEAKKVIDMYEKVFQEFNYI